MTINKKSLLLMALILMSFQSYSLAAGKKTSSSTTTTATTTCAPTSPSQPQASLTLNGGNLNICNTQSHSWSLTKVGGTNQTSVNWTVNSVKSSVSNNVIKSVGYLEIQNTSDGQAPIGNILVNLQRKTGNKWVTVSTDVADSTSGDAATSAKICSPASSEGLSTFSENSGSGSLEFTDAVNNTAFSLVPQPVLPANQSYKLLFSATFNNSVLMIPNNENVRFEVIVSFSNAGARGGSGASCSNVDISGNLTVEASEKYVRSIPSRSTISVLSTVVVNNSVLLSDTESQITTTGSASFSDYLTNIGAGSGTQSLSASSSNYVNVLVYGGISGGTITNCATLTNPDYIQTVNGPIDSLTGLPQYSYNFVCASGVNLSACDTQSIDGIVTPPPPTGDFASYTQGGWGATPNGNNPAMLLSNNFNSVFPSGYVLVGKSTGFWMKFMSAADVSNYLPAGGPGSSLTSNLLNPTSSSAGVFGGQVLALQLNVSFSQASVTQSGFGSLKLKDTGTPLDGLTVTQVLAMANELLGGGTVSGVTIAMMNPIVTNLNESFDNGNMSSWASTHLE